MFAGASRLDGGVQSQKVGLLGNRGDQLHDFANLLRPARQLADAAVGLLGLHDSGFRVCEVSGRTATPGVFFGNEAPRVLVLAEKRG